MDWSYLAGFFDGEGSIILDGKRAIVVFGNTDEEVINQIRHFIEPFVGCRNIYVEKKRNPKHKTFYRLDIYNWFGTRQILEKMLPYLIIKKQRAEEAIEWIDKKEWGYNRIYKFVNQKVTMQTLIKLRKQGLTQKEIGERYGVSGSTIGRHLRGESGNNEDISK